MTILAGDLGGTKTLLGLFDDEGRRLHACRFESGAHGGLSEILVSFLEKGQELGIPAPGAGVIGVAGATEERGGQTFARITNLGWDLSSADLCQSTGLGRLRLVNDFYAAAAAVHDLAEAGEAGGLVALNPSASPAPRGTIAVLGAGTGLGEAIICRAQHPPIILATEGGHADFAPRDEIEIALLRFLQQRHGGHVSYERILSGAGLLSLFEFYAGYDPDLAPPRRVLDEIAAAGASAPAVVSRLGLSGEDPTCAAALRRFASVYGAESGNFALKSMALGGVYLCGGIAPKILPILQGGSFMQGFLSKGRFAELCVRMPVHVVTQPDVGLLGALALARQM